MTRNPRIARWIAALAGLAGNAMPRLRLRKRHEHDAVPDHLVAKLKSAAVAKRARKAEGYRATLPGVER